MNGKEVLAYFKKNELKYAQFREIANVLQWQFPHDLFDDLPVQCIVYQPRLHTQFVESLGQKNTRALLAGHYGVFVPSLRSIIIHLPNIAKHYPENLLYARLLTTIEHEYLHAYFHFNPVLTQSIWREDLQQYTTRTALIKTFRKEVYEPHHKNNRHYAWLLNHYSKAVRKLPNAQNALEEEFLIQFYTSHFEERLFLAGTHYFDKLIGIMQDVHPYFTIAKAPKHVGKKLEKIAF
jgi:hypothetical protein